MVLYNKLSSVVVVNCIPLIHKISVTRMVMCFLLTFRGLVISILLIPVWIRIRNPVIYNSMLLVIEFCNADNVA